MRTKKSDWLFYSEVAELNPDVEIIGKYIDCSTKIKVKCKKCGEVYYDTPTNILSGRLHKKTSNGKKCSRWCITQTHTQDEIREIVKKLRYIQLHISELEFISPYNPITKKVQCKCKDCDNIFFESLDVLYNLKYSCSKCGLNKNISKLKTMINNNRNITLISRSNSVAKCICKECGDTFCVTNYTNKRKIVCPNCYQKTKNTSKK